MCDSISSVFGKRLYIWVLAYQGAVVEEGKGNHPCPLCQCDIAPLEDSVMGHLLSNHCRELGLETDLKWLRL